MIVIKIVFRYHYVPSTWYSYHQCQQAVPKWHLKESWHVTNTIIFSSRIPTGTEQYPEFGAIYRPEQCRNLHPRWFSSISGDGKTIIMGTSFWHRFFSIKIDPHKIWSPAPKSRWDMFQSDPFIQDKVLFVFQYNTRIHRWLHGFLGWKFRRNSGSGRSSGHFERNLKTGTITFRHLLAITKHK